MQLDDFNYTLPPELIAQFPTEKREDSRLLQLDGASGAVSHHRFAEIADFFRPGDLLVCNNTRVIPARLFAQKSTGGRCELLIERLQSETRALAQIRASKSPAAGAELSLCADATAAATQDRIRVTGRQGRFFEIEFISGSATTVMEQYGHIPLPPYIERADQISDHERYQTVFAREPGAVAAPTAGLHFSEALLAELEERGVVRSEVTLHVGAGTFQPVQAENITEHVMHKEWLRVDQALVDKVAETRAQGGRIVALGTTSVRALETAARCGELRAFEGDSDIFIYPGFQFQVVDAMITNFHLPKSTLLMLVSAFAGRDNVLRAYREAVAARYRFFSYGDAMLVLPQSGGTSSPEQNPL